MRPVRPVVVFAGFLAAIPTVMAVSAVATSWWYEHRYLPRIAGGD